MAGTRKQRRSRKSPGQPIEWKKFFEMDFVGRDVRHPSLVRNQVVSLSRGPIKRITTVVFMGLPMVNIVCAWAASMRLVGARSGEWERDNNLVMSFAPGNRPWLLPDGRILIRCGPTEMFDILPVGDCLDHGEIQPED